jgi:hypothetical protein
MKLKIGRYLIILVLLLAGFIGSRVVFNKPVLLVKYINQWPGFTINNLNMLNDLLSEKYKVVVDQSSDNYDLVIDGVFGQDEIQKKDAIKIFFTGEAVERDLNQYDLSIGFAYVDSAKYARIPLDYMSKNGVLNNTSYSRGECNPNKPYFTCFLFSNRLHKNQLNGSEYDGVILRDRLFHRLSLYKRVESGGGHLNNRGEVVKPKETQEFFSKCKFIIAYENQSFPGYITEKVYQAYRGGAVPIYYSDLKAVKDINKEAIIYVPDFSTEEDLVEYIKKIDNDDKLYCEIWSKKIIDNPEKNYDVLKDQLRKKLDNLFLVHPIKNDIFHWLASAFSR